MTVRRPGYPEVWPEQNAREIPRAAGRIGRRIIIIIIIIDNLNVTAFRVFFFRLSPVINRLLQKSNYYHRVLAYARVLDVMFGNYKTFFFFCKVTPMLR